MVDLRRIPALALAALLAGCATSDYLYVVPREVTCSPLADAVAFLPEPPDQPHVDVARLEATGPNFVPTTWENLRFYVCLNALAVDADAVVGLEQHRIRYGIGFLGFKLEWDNKRLTGIGIRYLEPGEQPEDVEAPPVDEDGNPIADTDAKP